MILIGLSHHCAMILHLTWENRPILCPCSDLTKILRDILIKMCPGLKNSLQVIGSDCKEYIKRNLYCFSIRNTVIIYKAC